MTKRKSPPLTKAERAIAEVHYQAYLHGESCEIALEKAMFETREHVLKAFEVHVGGDPTLVFADTQAKAEFLALVQKLRRQR